MTGTDNLHKLLTSTVKVESSQHTNFHNVSTLLNNEHTQLLSAE